MEYINLAESDLKISRIVFGAWAIGGWMWGGADKKDALEAIHAAIDNGVTTIDTAPVYGFGQSEELVGEAIKDRKDKVQILTKYGLSWDKQKGEFFFDSKDNQGNPVKIYKYSSRENVIAECEASLKRLGVDVIDLLQIHWPDNTTSVEETMEAMEILKSQGKIREAGVCNYNLELFKKANKSFPLVSNQVPYSMVNRKIEDDLVPWCVENKKSILAYSPLQRGLLTGKITTDYNFNSGDSRSGNAFYTPERIKKVNQFLSRLEPIKMDHEITNAQLVLRWTLDQPGITAALAGARNKQQVLDNIKAVDFKLSPTEVELVDSELTKMLIQF